MKGGSGIESPIGYKSDCLDPMVVHAKTAAVHLGMPTALCEASLNYMVALDTVDLVICLLQASRGQQTSEEEEVSGPMFSDYHDS